MQYHKTRGIKYEDNKPSLHNFADVSCPAVLLDTDYI